MLDRLSQIIKIKQLSASQFADEIGVQRSSVSHVLSGRNKPSLDFITKVALRFPDINTEWLLTGRGQMLFQTEESEDFGDTNVKTADIIEEKTAEVEDDNDRIAEKIAREVVSKAKTGRDRSQAGSVSIEKIVIFYNNGSFSDYSPNG